MTAPERLAGRFRLDRELGRGATGVVWESWDEAGERVVAVKLLHRHLTRDAAALATLEAEAAAAGRLQHPGILEVHGLWAHGDRRLVVSERVSGQALGNHDGPLPADQALLVAEQVADALAFAHRTGRLHGDVRPGNILLGPTGAKLFDFGIARWVGAIQGVDRPGPTVRAGCSAPEVLDGGTPGVPADLYGVGVVLYRAWTGRLPWDGPTPFAVMGLQRAGAPDLGDFPKGVRSLLRGLLQAEPDQRPADMAAVVRMLGQLRRNPGSWVSFGGRWIAPVRPLRAWVVHGRDPATGGPAVMREGLGRGPARALVSRLRQDGWEVEASKEALDLTDLAWAGFGALVASWLIPVVGWILAVPLVLRWRSAGLRYRLREALPVARAPLPARRLPPGNEVAVAAGLLLLLLVPSLLLFPPMVLPVGAALIWLAVTSWRGEPDPAYEAVRAGRIETALAEAAALIESRELDFDANLGLHGELLSLEREWKGGGSGSDDVLVRVEDLCSRAHSLQRGALLGLVPRPDDDEADGP